MHRTLCPAALIPPGPIIDQTHAEPQQMTIAVNTAHRFVTRPSCCTLSSRVQSHYLRRGADLPLAGQPVQIVIRALRISTVILCGADSGSSPNDMPGCDRPLCRRTTRLEVIAHHLG